MKINDNHFPRIVMVNDSTNVTKIAYNPMTFNMVVTFKEDVKYIYFDVARTTFGNIVSTDSVGKALNTFIQQSKPRTVKMPRTVNIDE